MMYAFAISVTYIYSDALLDILKFLIFFTAACLPASVGRALVCRVGVRGSNPAELTPRDVK